MTIADLIFNRPHLVHPVRAQVMLWALRERLGLEMPAPSREAAAFFGRPARSGMYRVENGAAIIPVIGTLVNRGGWVGAKSGLVAYEALEAQLREALADGEVRRIVLDIDSPGGTVDGVSQLADLIRAARDRKPVTAVVNDMAASAAYWLASQAEEIVISPTSVVGSIGVIYIHTDMSRALESAGVTVTIITAGEHKADGNPYEPLPGPVRDEIAAELERIREMFIGAVHVGRPSLSTDALRRTEARVYTGEAAIEMGLADRIGTLAEVLGVEENESMSTKKTDGIVAAATQEKAEAEPKIDEDALRREGARAERERIAAILGLDEAVGRMKLAVKLALTTDIGPEAAREVLAAAPKEDVPMPLPSVAAESTMGLELTTAAESGKPDAKERWNKVLARLGAGQAN